MFDWQIHWVIQKDRYNHMAREAQIWRQYREAAITSFHPPALFAQAIYWLATYLIKLGTLLLIQLHKRTQTCAPKQS